MRSKKENFIFSLGQIAIRRLFNLKNEMREREREKEKLLVNKKSFQLQCFLKRLLTRAGQKEYPFTLANTKSAAL